jgi:Na+-driven multidrug efflux pump
MSLPFGLSTAISIRIGSLLGAQQKETAASSAKITIVLGTDTV